MTLLFTVYYTALDDLLYMMLWAVLSVLLVELSARAYILERKETR